MVKQQQPNRSGLSATPSAPQTPAQKKDIYDPSLYDVSFQTSGGPGTYQSGGWQVGSYDYGSNANSNSQDADVRAAQYYLNAYNDPTRSSGKNITYRETGIRNLYEQAMQRVAQKKALSQSIQDAQGNLGSELDLIKKQGGAALNEGLNNTRENFNSRGLLYSGAREGGEGKVKGAAAATMAESSANARRDNSKLVDARKEAFARIGLADQSQAIERANQVFESTMRNQAARAQAIQQLASGVGYAAGAYYGSGSGNSNTAKPPAEDYGTAGNSYLNTGAIA